MSVNRLAHFQEWLHLCARQYCLTNNMKVTINPLDLAACLAKMELLLKESESKVSKVLPGKSVQLFDLQMQEKVTFILVSPEDSDPGEAKLSFLSPLGSQLLGCTLGDIVEVNVFGRKESFQVIGIES